MSKNFNLTESFITFLMKNYNIGFSQVKNWVKELKKMLGNDICLTIAGNKIDLEKQRTVMQEDAEK
jgi:Ras family.